MLIISYIQYTNFFYDISSGHSIIFTDKGDFIPNADFIHTIARKKIIYTLFIQKKIIRQKTVRPTIVQARKQRNDTLVPSTGII